jgi:hypothetical protein
MRQLNRSLYLVTRIVDIISSIHVVQFGHFVRLVHIVRILLVVFLSTSAHYCSAQVQVSQEPRHHKVFDNGWVRILDVHIPPGDTSMYHIHSTPSVFLILSNTKTGSEVLVEPAKTSFTNGNIWFEGFYEKPRIHRVWNEDTVEFHVIDMELSHPNPQEIDAPLTQSGFTLLFDEKPVRGYRLTLDAGKSVHLKHRKAPVVVIDLSDIEGQTLVNGTVFQHKGNYLFLPPGKDIDFVNKDPTTVALGVFELK